MTDRESRGEPPEFRATGDDAAAVAPRIVNGLTVRPRKKINLWYFGLCFLPDFAVLLVVAGLAVRRLLRYLDVKAIRS
jgi:hypothetical protein